MSGFCVADKLYVIVGIDTIISNCAVCLIRAKFPSKCTEEHQKDGEMEDDDHLAKERQVCSLMGTAEEAAAAAVVGLCRASIPGSLINCCRIH